MRKSTTNKVVHCAPELTGCFLAAFFPLLEKVIMKYHTIAIEQNHDKSIPILYSISMTHAQRVAVLSTISPFTPRSFISS
jgi:hypothetical protein